MQEQEGGLLTSVAPTATFSPALCGGDGGGSGGNDGCDSEDGGNAGDGVERNGQRQ